VRLELSLRRKTPLKPPGWRSSASRAKRHSCSDCCPALESAGQRHAILRLRMSRENVDLTLLMYEIFNRRDLDAMLALMHDRVEIAPRLGALEGDYRGHDGVRRWWSDLLGLLPDYTAEVAEVEDVGDMTLGHIRGRAHGAASAAPVLEEWWQSLLWRDGRCVRWSNFATKADALESIDLG
jgi:ketosteroid isomerase-like protein